MLTHLLLMRHAKSSWSTGHPDHQRPLNARGERSADIIGQTLHAQGTAPQLIWASDSTRTRQTALRLIRVIPGAQSVSYIPEFYHASSAQAFAVCAERGQPAVERLMLLGHNPGWGDMFYALTGKEHPFPTAACAVFKRRAGSQDWLSPESWVLSDLLLPSALLAEHGPPEEADDEG